jgi:hypothetical protein
MPNRFMQKPHLSYELNPMLSYLGMNECNYISGELGVELSIELAVELCVELGFKL